ncbi:MAG: Flagellar biosynthetic protein FlhB [Pseudomonadota bacterium]|jgi:flagellar biosynthetic protein FlhB
MADQSSGQDRTEAPTARKLRKAREEGQVARSTELPAATIVIGSFLLILMMGGWLMTRLADLFVGSFIFNLKTLAKPELLPTIFADRLIESFVLFLPLILLTIVLAIVASGMTGGYFFSVKAISPKASKLDPLQGFKRMFGLRAMVELGKALLKFFLVTGVLWASIASNTDTLVAIGRMSLEPALWAAGGMIAKSAVWVAMSLAVIAMIDVPYQKYQFIKRMRMTKQEVKDEMKDIEGRPEVKAQIRRRQREMSNARMMRRVKDADVVITNPEHFAVALEYDPAGDGAPVLVAKGTDFMAQNIREEAQRNGVQIFAAPPLARALYFTTELERPVPESLYHAVAQVIAYVYSLEAAQPGRGQVKKPQPNVPPDMQFDANGRKMDA